MTWPKKKRRKIIVNGVLYYWKVFFDEHCPYCENGFKRLTIQNTETKQSKIFRWERHTENDEKSSKYASITPREVKKFIIDNKL